MNALRHGEVLVIAPEAPPYGGMAAQAQLLVQLMRADGVAVAFLPSNVPLPRWLKAANNLCGVRTVLRFFVFCRRLWHRLATAEVALVLTASWAYFFLVSAPVVALCRVRAKRVVINYRGGEAGQFFDSFGPLVRPFFRMADQVTAPSDFLVDIIERMITVRVEVVPNIVKSCVFLRGERQPLRPKMLVTRHLEKLYDIESVIRAFRAAKARFGDATLSIAGTGSEETRLRNMVAEWGLEGIEFLGYVPPANLAAIYDEHDILLNASRADNFPGSLLEAAAAGLVVISTNVGGIPYIFEDGRSALLTEAGDWAGLADRVVQVLNDGALAAALRKEALNVSRQYEWANVRRSLYRALGKDEMPTEEVVCTVG